VDVDHNIIWHEDFKASDFGPTFSIAREADGQEPAINVVHAI